MPRHFERGQADGAELAEFELRHAWGLFAFHWQAHGNHYAIGGEVHLWRQAGVTVVVSGSREHFKTAGGIDEAEAFAAVVERPDTRGNSDLISLKERGGTESRLPSPILRKTVVSTREVAMSPRP